MSIQDTDFEFQRREKWFQLSVQDGLFRVACRYYNGQWQTLLGRNAKWMEWEVIDTSNSLNEAKRKAIAHTQKVASEILIEAQEIQVNRWLIWECLAIAIALGIWAKILRLI